MKNNCLFVVVRQKVLHWKDTDIRVRWVEKWEVPHFYWYSKGKGKHFHFSAKRKDLPTIQMIWFEGRIKRFFFH